MVNKKITSIDDLSAKDIQSIADLALKFKKSNKNSIEKKPKNIFNLFFTVAKEFPAAKKTPKFGKDMLPFKSILETNSRLLSPKTVILNSSPGAKI